MDRIVTDCNGRKYITNESSQDKRIAELEAKLAIAKEALEYYAKMHLMSSQNITATSALNKIRSE